MGRILENPDLYARLQAEQTQYEQEKAKREEWEKRMVLRKRRIAKRSEQLRLRMERRWAELERAMASQYLKQKTLLGLTRRQMSIIVRARLLKREEMARSLIYASEEVWGAFWEVFSRESANNFLLPDAFETFNREYEVAVCNDISHKNILDFVQ